MLKRLLATAVLLALALPTAAQDACSELSLTREIGPRDNAAMSSMIVEVAGAPALSPTWLAIGLSDEGMVLDLGGDRILKLGIAQPIAMPFLGRTNERGSVSRTFMIPNNLDLLVYTQAITVEMRQTDVSSRATLAFCTSNVARMEL